MLGKNCDHVGKTFVFDWKSAKTVQVFSLKSFIIYYSMYGTVDIFTYHEQAAEEQRQWLHQQYIEKDK